MKKVTLVTLVFLVLSNATISSYAFDSSMVGINSANKTAKDNPFTQKSMVGINSVNGTAMNNQITGNGQVVLINKDKTMVTLKHDPIAAIHWPAMTMAFKVKNSAVLAKSKVGDKVSFTLAPDGKNYMVTSIK